MRYLRTLACLALLPVIGCMSMPNKEPSAARGKEAAVLMEEESSIESESAKIMPDSINDDNYRQQLEAFRRELAQPRIPNDSKYAFAEKK